MHSHLESIACALRMAHDPCSFQGLDRIFPASLTCSRFGCFDHPIRVLIAQRIQPFIVLAGIIETLHALFQLSLGRVHIRTVVTNCYCPPVSIDRSVEIFKDRQHLCLQNSKARVLRRSLHSLACKIGEHLLLAIAHRIECGFPSRNGIFRIGAQDRDVLLHSTLIVLRARQRWNQTSSEQYCLLLAILCCHGQRRIVNRVQFTEIKLL